MPLPIRCGEGPSPQQRGASRAARRRARVARRERYVRRRDRGRRVRGRSCGHVLFDRRPTLASCVSSPPTITRSGLQRSSAVFRRATPGPPCVRGRMAQHVRGLPGRRRACAAAAVMQVWPARGIRAMLERRAPSAGSASAQAADRPAAFDETNGVPCFGGAAGKLAGVSPHAGRRCPLAPFEHAFFIGSLT